MLNVRVVKPGIRLPYYPIIHSNNLELTSVSVVIRNRVNILVARHNVFPDIISEAIAKIYLKYSMRLGEELALYYLLNTEVVGAEGNIRPNLRYILLTLTYNATYYLKEEISSFRRLEDNHVIIYTLKIYRGSADTRKVR